MGKGELPFAYMTWKAFIEQCSRGSRTSRTKPPHYHAPREARWWGPTHCVEVKTGSGEQMRCLKTQPA
eukprot:6472868-Prorocentrum_lima.AAC.1